MPAESIFQAIPTEAIRSARARLAYEDLSVEEWAKREGFKAKSVYQVLSGKRMAIRGDSLRIAIKLGLRPDPSKPAAQPDLPVQKVPAGHTVAGGPPVLDQNRRPNFQPAPLLGEAAR